VKVNFSRHAKRRAKLYGISESTILDIIIRENLAQGKHDVIKHIAGFKYPLKIVVQVDKNSVTVITNYPLKKGIKK